MRVTAASRAARGLPTAGAIYSLRTFNTVSLHSTIVLLPGTGMLAMAVPYKNWPDNLKELY